MVTQGYEKLINLYHGINVYCAIGAVVFLAAAIALFILLKIPRVFGELTGKTAQRAISQMTSGDMSENMSSSKIGNDGRQKKKSKTGMLGTGRLRRNTGALNRKIQETAITAQMPDKMQTYGAETEIIDRNIGTETEVLNRDTEEETGVLNACEEFSTDILEEASFVILRSIVEIHTDEVI